MNLYQISKTITKTDFTTEYGLGDYISTDYKIIGNYKAKSLRSVYSLFKNEYDKKARFGGNFPNYIVKEIDFDYCKNCGSKLGVDCGDAEADFNEEFCSFGCHAESIGLKIKKNHE